LSVFIAGPPRRCSRCQSEELVLLDESFDEIDQVYVGEVRCYKCLCEMVYARRGRDPVPAYFTAGLPRVRVDISQMEPVPPNGYREDDKEKRGGVMQLFEMPKIGVFCDSFKPRIQKKRDHEIKLVDVTLRIEPLTSEQAATVGGNGFVKKSLFNLSHGTVVPNLKMVAFDVEVPRQQIHVFPAPDVDRPSFVFDQVDITNLRAKMAKGARWAFVFHATFGPVSKQELEGLNAWFCTQRFLTFKEAAPELEFGEEGSEADQKARQAPVADGPAWEEDGGKVEQAPKVARGGRARGPRRLPGGHVEGKKKGTTVN
jgi:hypothetical protein